MRINHLMYLLCAKCTKYSPNCHREKKYVAYRLWHKNASKSYLYSIATKQQILTNDGVRDLFDRFDHDIRNPVQQYIQSIASKIAYVSIIFGEKIISIRGIEGDMTDVIRSTQSALM
eukprot:520211_1